MAECREELWGCPMHGTREGAWVHPAHTHVVAALTCRAACGCCPQCCTLSAERPSPCLCWQGRGVQEPGAGSVPVQSQSAATRIHREVMLVMFCPEALSQAQGCDLDRTPGDTAEGACCKPNSLGASSRGGRRDKGQPPFLPSTLQT